MLCVSCSTPIPDGSHFCMSCGADVSDPSRHSSASLTDLGVSNMERLLRDDTQGEFEIERELGRGGMAVVYVATEIHLKRKIAIKVLPPELTFGAGTIERFQREAQTAAALDHPNIIPIYRVSTGGELFWYAMKYVEGRSLEDIHKEKGRADLDETINIMKELAAALDWAHGRNVVHRDVKPANIMIDEVGRATVTDFGIAKALTSTSLTASGSAIGTPNYMSPEQCMGKEITGAADQYSLAVMTFQMLSGQLPFEADSAVELIHKHCYLAPPPLDVLRPGLPAHVYVAVNKALEKKAPERFDSVGEFVEALSGGGVAGTTEQPRSSSTWDRVSTKLVSQVVPRRRSGLAVTGAGAVVVLGAVGGWWWITQGPSAAEEGAAQPPAVGADRGGGALVSADSMAGVTTAADTGEGLAVAANEPVEPATPEEQTPTPVENTLSADTTETTPMREEAAVADPPPTAAPQSGVLIVSITGGWAKISIDGMERREGRTYRDTLTAGEHSLRLERPGFATVDTAVNVEPGETLTVTLTMRRSGA